MGYLITIPIRPKAVQVELSPDYARRLSGLDLRGEEMAALLERLAFSVEPYGDHLLVTVPDHRLDIEGPHDLVEEICRMVGYDKIPSTVISDELPPQRGNPDLEREERVRDLLVQLGLAGGDHLPPDGRGARSAATIRPGSAAGAG